MHFWANVGDVSHAIFDDNEAHEARNQLPPLTRIVVTSCCMHPRAETSPRWSRPALCTATLAGYPWANLSHSSLP